MMLRVDAAYMPGFTLKANSDVRKGMGFVNAYWWLASTLRMNLIRPSKYVAWSSYMAR